MVRTAVGRGSNRGRGVGRRHEDARRYVRFSEEQIEVLEEAYSECSHPDHFRCQQILHDPVMRGIDITQVKVWFQNRRCREKNKNEGSGKLVCQIKRLIAANSLLRNENDGLQKQLARLICENEDLRNQVLILTARTTTHGFCHQPEVATSHDFHHQPEVSYSELPVSAPENTSLLLLAEETRKEFLSKATGTAIVWIPASWLKLLSPDSVGTIYVPLTCTGVAARACVTIPFEPVKIMEILKDRTSWCRGCRNMDVVASYPVNNGGTIELIYTQYYAPTIMACARDFWTLRYTCVLDDGCFVVCEKSISGCDAAPSSPAALEFVRGRMLASGYMIQPSGMGSTIHLLQHFDFEASSVPEVVRPLYESSQVVAKNLLLSALHYIEHVACEKNGVKLHASREDPASVRTLCHKVSRGFNVALSCFSEDEWTLMNADASDDIIVSIKQTKNVGVSADFDSVICVKASLILQNVSPASLVRLLKEHRSAWMDFNFSSHSRAYSEAASFAYPSSNTHNLCEKPTVLGYSNYEDETLEALRFTYTGNRQHHVFKHDLHHLQISNGLEDIGFGACSELIFAPIQRNIPEDATLLSSGFRICFLGSNTGTNSLANQAPNEDYNTENGEAVVDHTNSMMVLAFQFPFKAHLLTDITAMAREYIQHVISAVKILSLEATPPASNLSMNPTVPNPAMGSNSTSQYTFALNLANFICQSYRSILGADIPGLDYQLGGSMLEVMQNHEYAILCFSVAQPPTCLYANQTALNMVETTSDNLQNIMVDSILAGSTNLSLYSLLPTIMQQGYAILPPGSCLSLMDSVILYEQAVVWQVREPDGLIPYFAIAIIDWSIL